MARESAKKIENKVEKKGETSTTLLEAAKKVLRQNGYAGLSTRDVAAAAGVPLSQIHYHFGSKQGMVLALFEYLNAQLLDRQNAMFGDASLKLSEQWDRACDYLDDDIASVLRRKARPSDRLCGGSAISFVVPKPAHRKGDVMRAKLPSKSGFVDRDGVKIYYEIYGDGPETMVFLPPWPIVHSRIYKAQLPYFSERFRCITFDARGNGKSDRPADAAAYSLEQYVADALAVMDATEVGNAILVGLSSGGMHASVLAAHHPERVKAAILVGTVASIGPANFPCLATKHFEAKREHFDGWDKFNREYWMAN